MKKRNTMQLIGARLRKRRIHLQMSQSELARAMNTTQAEISRIENGKANYTVLTLDRICNELGLIANVYRLKINKKVTGNKVAK